MTETWDFLTRSPLATTPTNYRLKGEVGTIQRGGAAHERWQHKPRPKGTAYIWSFVDERTVYLEQVHTSHPNETKWPSAGPKRRSRHAGGHDDAVAGRPCSVDGRSLFLPAPARPTSRGAKA
ncbi:hypothetical protein [Streptomyces armeniacus]|uniref:hypothetical protein n=1 Tax=Streptomyces armeniacus TaxID=83291 RepID=UPI001FE7CA58|nr:hypothetical protein [Streptomyces armeniacus]